MQLGAVIFVAVPWLNPFSAGPTPAVVSLLFSWTCAAVVYGIGLRTGCRSIFSKTAAAAWLMAALVSAWVGLLQYFGATVAFGSWISSTDVGTAFANLRQRNQFATLTNMGLAALLWWMEMDKSTPGYSPNGTVKAQWSWRFIAPLAAVLLLAAGNAASSSRTGLVQLVMLVIMRSIWARSAYGDAQRGMRNVMGAGVLTYGIAAMGLPVLAGLDLHATGILARMHDGDSICSSRLTLWSNVLHLIAQKPWLGWGWGELDYAHFITLYPGDRFCGILDNAHNLPLHLAVELGVPLALVFCGLCGWLVLRAQPWREMHPTRQMAWSVLALIGLHSLLEYPLWFGPFQVAVVLCVGLLWLTPAVLAGDEQSLPASAYQAREDAIQPMKVGPRARAFIAWLAMLLLAFCAFVAWEYWRVSQIYLAPAARAPAYRDHTLEKIRDTWLFQDQVRFAELTTTPLTPHNAPQMLDLAKALLHFSPEPLVVQKLIDSAALLGRQDEAQFYQERFNAAFRQAPR